MASGGWRDSDRRRTLPADWAKTRAMVLKRDGGRCVRCGAPANQVDHIGRRDNHMLENLQSLCATCHQRKTSAQAVSARRLKAGGRFRPRESHPGIRRNSN
jgi:5-methylcytosine-specific restriction endonuclease McrA